MELERFKIAVLPLREKMLHTAVRLTDNAEDAEDVVQDSFLKLWNIRDQLDGYHSVEALAVTVTKNRALDYLRVKRQHGGEEELLRVSGTSLTPDSALEQQDAVACIHRLIDRLPPLQQAIIRMKDIEGYESAEIAEIMGTTADNVKSNLSRARKKIREQFLAINTERG